MVEEFKIRRINEVSATKVNIDFRTLRSAFNQAIRWKKIRENPFSQCRSIKTPAKKPIHLSKAEFDLLLAAIDMTWFKEIVVFAVATMMRAGEIVNLRWDAVDMEQRTITIENSEGFKTKTGKARRIPMDDGDDQFP